MENVANALKIGFAIFVFVIALTITFSFVSQAKSTADHVLFYADKSNFYDYAKSSGTNRTVSVADVVSTLYRYNSGESIGVIVNLNDNTYTFDLNNNEYINNEEYKELDNANNREKNLSEFISDKLLKLPEEAEFNEEFVEIPISGIYDKGEDDTEIVLSAGGKKVYVTYTYPSKT